MQAHNLQFLLIEPDENFQEIVHEVVAKLGYGQVLGVANVREALTALSTGTIDFVICDWSDDTGPEIGLLKVMKKQELYRYIPVLFTATHQNTEAERIKRAVAAGCDGYLRKPYEEPELKRALDEVLSRYPAL